MKKYWAILNHYSFSFLKLSFSTLILSIVAWISLISSAQAAYLYTYTGNSFTTSIVSPNWGGEMSCNPDPGASCIETREERVHVKFVYSKLLSDGINLPDNFSFSISTNDVNDPYRNRELAYPFVYPYPSDYPFPIPEFPLGTPENPYNTGTFNISSVNSFGLPTDWNISIYNEYNNSHDNIVSFIETSTTMDSTSGTTSRFSNYSGQLDNAPGIWTVSEVPEPSTYMLLLLGLGFIVLSAMRHDIGGGARFLGATAHQGFTKIDVHPARLGH